MASLSSDRLGSSATALLTGAFVPAPGRIVHMSSSSSAIALADVPERGRPMRVHVARVASDGALRFETPWEVPLPPSLDRTHDLSGSSAFVDLCATPAGLAVALTRIEYQGGSHGIALATLGASGWGDESEIESPTDSDISFGTPLFRRGDAVVTTEAEDRLWHYERRGAGWKGTEYELPDRGSIVTAPPMATRDDASEFALAYHHEARGHAVAFYRRVAGEFRIVQELFVTQAVSALAYAEDLIYVGFARPVEDGALVWALSRSPSGAYAVAERRVLPAPADPRHHLVGLCVSPRWLLAQGPDAVWAVPRATTESPRRLAVPTKSSDTLALLLGDRAVVLCGEQLAVFELR